MISNERPSPYGRRPYQSSQGYGAPKYNSQPRPPVNEDTLKTAEVQIERKFFVFTLKENPRGRFLRITEDVGGRRDTIIIPAPGLEKVKAVVERAIGASISAGPSTQSLRAALTRRRRAASSGTRRAPVRPSPCSPPPS